MEERSDGHSRKSLHRLPGSLCQRGAVPALTAVALRCCVAAAIMAASSSGVVTLVPGGAAAQPEVDAEMSLFLAEVERIEKDPEKMTGEEHIERMFRPGSKYFNMNPFEVLGCAHTASADDVKKAYRRVSLLVHPDKNPGNPRAQDAFEIVKAAHDRLLDEERLTFCQRICQAATDAVEKKVKSQKKKQRKEGRDEAVPEDDPARLATANKIMISRMFAEFEQRKKVLEQRDKDQRKKAQEEQAEREFMEALQKREEKMWEKSRQKRVQGWRSWSNGAGVVKNKIPRVKEERRADGSSGYNQGNDERGMGYRKDWR